MHPAVADLRINVAISSDIEERTAEDPYRGDI